MKLENNTLSLFCVRNEDGSTNIDATVHKFREQLGAYVAKRETEITALSLAIDTVFDEKPAGSFISKSFIVHRVTQILNVDNDSFVPMQLKVLEYLKDASGENGIYVAKRAVGLGRRRDQALTPIDRLA